MLIFMLPACLVLCARRRILIGLSVFVLAVMGAQTARAASSDEFHEQWYIGTGLGVTEINPDTRNTGYSVADDADSGFKLFAGYDYDSNFSVEAFFATLGTAKLSNNGFPTLNPDGEIDYATMGASVLWYFWHKNSDEDYISRRGWQTYLHAGLSLLDNSSNVNYTQENSAQIHFGVGLEYGWDNGLAVRGSIDSFDQDASLISVNLLKRFGDRQTIPEDSDKDGVSNTNDKCPDTVAGRAVDALGCALILDADADGVVDAIDQCPDTVKDVEVDARGCTIKQEADSDKDNVLDSEDLCPDSPRNIPVNVKGCTVFDAATQGINFEPGSAKLTAQSRTILDDLASTLLVLSQVQIEIKAHTDSQGESTYNKQLSRGRADSVLEYLQAQGITVTRMTAMGYGEERPVADNKTAAGRARNRRVEFEVLPMGE